MGNRLWHHVVLVMLPHVVLLTLQHVILVMWHHAVLVMFHHFVFVTLQHIILFLHVASRCSHCVASHSHLINALCHWHHVKHLM